MPIGLIDVAAWVEFANVCDANGWAVSGRVFSTDDKWEVLKAICQAGAAVPMKLNAMISVMVQAPRVSLATVTGKDVVGKVSVQAQQSRRDRFNAVAPRFVNENIGWQFDYAQGSPIIVDDYVSVDGGQRTLGVDFALVGGADAAAVQAAQLARYALEDSREFGPITLPCKPYMLGYRPGDCITVNEPEYGLNGQLLLIVGRSFDPMTGMVTLTCRSETTGKHAYALGQTATAPPTPGITGYDPGVLIPPGADTWDITGSSFVGDGQAPAILIGGACDDPTASQIIVDYRKRLTADPSWGDWASASFPVSATLLTITGVEPGAYYGVRVRYQSIRDVEDPDQSLDLGVVQVGAIEIADQGLLATLDAVEGAQLAAGVGKNCLVDCEFRGGFDWWRAYATDTSNGTVGSSNGLNYLQNTRVDESIGEYLALGSDNQVNSLPIVPGQLVEASAYAGGTGLSSLRIDLHWHNAAGVLLSGGAGSTTLQTVSTYGVGGGELDTYARIGGVAAAPAGAYRCSLHVVGVLSSTTANIRLAKPMLDKALAGQAELTPWNAGLDATPGADITGDNTALAIVGQGSMATRNIFKQATAPVSGMASGDLWVKNDVTPNVLYIYDQSSTTWVQATPTQAAQILYADGVTTIEALKPAGAGADQTSSHTAAAITGQGLLATLNAIASAQLAAGVGKNCLVDCEFRAGFTWWRAYATDTSNGTAGSSNGLRYLQNARVDESIGEYLALGSDNQVNSLPIVPGQLVEASAYAGGVGLSSLRIDLHWHDATGTLLSSTTLQTVSSYGAGGGELTTYTRIGGVGTAPAGAYRCSLHVVGVLSSTTANVRLAKPMLDKALAGQTELTPWNVGLDAAPGADVTADNTALAVVGQGTLATRNIFRQATAPVSGMASGDLWVKNSVTPNVLYIYDQSSTTWVQASPTQAAQILYADGVTTIEALKPAGTGADQTSSPHRRRDHRPGHPGDPQHLPPGDCAGLRHGVPGPLGEEQRHPERPLHLRPVVLDLGAIQSDPGGADPLRRRRHHHRGAEAGRRGRGSDLVPYRRRDHRPGVVGDAERDRLGPTGRRRRQELSGGLRVPGGFHLVAGLRDRHLERHGRLLERPPLPAERTRGREHRRVPGARVRQPGQLPAHRAGPAGGGQRLRRRCRPFLPEDRPALARRHGNPAVVDHAADRLVLRRGRRRADHLHPHRRRGDRAGRGVPLFPARRGRPQLHDGQRAARQADARQGPGRPDRAYPLERRPRRRAGRGCDGG
ncbi:MAG: hypothetical protein WDM92_06360 [Caulobacteraceae bacterium]